MKNEWKDEEVAEGGRDPRREDHGTDGGGNDRDHGGHESGGLACGTVCIGAVRCSVGTDQCGGSARGQGRNRD